MKKKLILLASAGVALLLTGCRITVNGSSSPFAMGLGGLVALGCGLLSYCNPELMFELTQGWRYRDLEPSDAGLESTRWSGLLMMAVGLVLLFNSCSA